MIASTRIQSPNKQKSCESCLSNKNNWARWHHSGQWKPKEWGEKIKIFQKLNLQNFDMLVDITKSFWWTLFGMVIILLQLKHDNAFNPLQHPVVFTQVPFPVLQGEGVEYLGRADEAIIAISNYRLHIKFKDSVINVSARLNGGACGFVCFCTNNPSVCNATPLRRPIAAGRRVQCSVWTHTGCSLSPQCFYKRTTELTR